MYIEPAELHLEEMGPHFLAEKKKKKKTKSVGENSQLVKKIHTIGKEPSANDSANFSVLPLQTALHFGEGQHLL